MIFDEIYDCLIKIKGFAQYKDLVILLTQLENNKLANYFWNKYFINNYFFLVIKTLIFFYFFIN